MSSAKTTPSKDTVVKYPMYPEGSHYNWTQKDNEVIISTRVYPNTLKSDITITMTDDTLNVSISPEPTPRIRGRLFATIKPSQSSWSIEDLPEPILEGHPNPYRVLIIRLAKTTRKNNWGLPVRSGISEPTDADPHSLYLVAATLFEHGDSGSLRLMTVAGDAGSVAAQLKLAAWYELGREEMAVIPVGRNPIASLTWHRKAALRGNAEACYIVMTAYASGTHGCEKSYLEAFKWAKECMENGHGPDIMAVEQKNLFVTVAFQTGLLLMEGGNGMGNPNPEAASVFWRQAALAGHGQSAWNLGIFYLNGFGVPVDIEEGVKLIKQGMSLVKELNLPPQLQGLTMEELDTLVELAKGVEDNRGIVMIESLVKQVKDMRTSKKKAAPRKASAKGKKVEEEKEKEKEEQEEVDVEGVAWDEMARRGVAVAMIAVGLWGIWRILKDN
ncbi:hypothetical protein HDU76_008904 [Blyttiomyces sp. JEL0837]|nr:hypothetical protein HDU76_008904 [Blyttiomyces sp. JEL0837]